MRLLIAMDIILIVLVIACFAGAFMALGAWLW